jgi:hypothetical protein
MTGEAPVLSLNGGVVKNIFRQGRSEREPETYVSKYVEGLSEVRSKPESFFTILGLTDGHHTVQCDPGPILLIIRHDDMVHDVAFGKILHRPTEVGSIDPEHRRALADRG